MEIVSADRVTPAALLEAANDAFSDYVVPTPAMPADAWAEMLHQRGFDARLSRLAMEDDAVEAYWLIGTAPKAWPHASYGISVGTRPRARRQGLSRKLWERVAADLREEGYRSHVLEVIETNARAVPLYEGLGFGKTRRVECFKGPAPQAAPPDGITFRNVAIEEADAVAATMRDWQPTWQNATPAAQNVRDAMAATLVFDRQIPVAFGYFHKPSGLVVQMAVEETHRRRGFARALLAHWRATHGKDAMAVLNVPDTAEASLAFFRGLGWENHVNQFEMQIAL